MEQHSRSIFRTGSGRLIACFLFAAVSAVLISIIRVVPLTKARAEITLGEADMQPHWAYEYSRFYFTSIPMDKGVYTVHADYTATQDLMVKMQGAWEGDPDIRSTPVRLPAYGSSREFRVISEQNGTLCTLSFYSAEKNDSYIPASIDVRIIYRRWLTVSYVILETLMPLFFLSVIVCLILFCRRKNDAELNRVVAALVLMTLFLSTPLFADYAVSFRNDTSFHMYRIAYLSDSLFQNGMQFGLQTGWFDGYGYPVGIFYGEVLLLPSAILYALGLPLWQCYQLLMLLIISLTVWGGYYCFARIADSRRAGLIGSFLYAGSMWYMARLYIGGTIGESSAMAFIPFVMLAFYELYRNRADSCLFLVIGFTGLLQSHIITTTQVVMFSAVFCLLHVRRLLSDGWWKQILKAAGMVVLLNLWFLVPFLDYYVRHDTIAKEGGALMYALDIPGLILGTADYCAPGSGILTALVFSAFLMFSWKEADRMRYVCRILFGFSVAAMFFSINKMPWEWIRSNLPPLYALLGEKLQFPFRYLTIAVGAVSCLFVLVLKKEERREEAEAADRVPDYAKNRTGTGAATLKKAAVFTMCLLTLLQDTDILKTVVYESEKMTMTDAAGMPEGGFEDSLYLITDGGQKTAEDKPSLSVRADEPVLLEAVSRRETSFSCAVTNRSGEPARVTFPIWNYYGYVAEGEGEQLDIVNGENYEVSVVVPGNYQGRISVGFRSPWYWRLAQGISLFTILLLAVRPVYKKKQNSGHSEPEEPREKPDKNHTR